MNRETELVIIGAGPAGIGAAVSAASHGVDVALVDSNAAAGGQVYRALPPEFRVRDAGALGPDHTLGETLRSELAASRVHTFFGHRVWSIASGFRVDAAHEAGTQAWQAKTLIAATGTTERIVPVPGWTLPGVIGLAAATILLKAQQMLPGKNVVVAGCGPLVGAVAAGIIKGGGRVAAAVDLASPLDWLKALPALASRPDLLCRGFGWLRLIRRSGVPTLFRHGIAEIQGTAAVDRIIVKPVDGDWRLKTDAPGRAIKADAVTIGHGLVPRTEVTRLLRARHTFEPARGGWVPVRDENFQTSVPGLFVAGDGAGVSGAAAAVLQGRIAGLAAAHGLGKLDRSAFERAAAPFRRALAKAERFGHAMSQVMAVRPGIVASIPADTVVCRCEDVTRAEIEDAVARGADDVNQLKAWTRCGMGPCQGRMCGEAAADIVAARVGGRERAGVWTARVPITPMPMEALVGAFTYDDIPKPPPAPA